MIHPDDRLKTFYEWVSEEVDEFGDIQDCNYCDTYKEAAAWKRELPSGWSYEIALVWNTRTESEGLQDREYAYIDAGKLPSAFEGGKKIPKRYHDELAKGLS